MEDRFKELFYDKDGQPIQQKPKEKKEHYEAHPEERQSSGTWYIKDGFNRSKNSGFK